MYNCHTLCIKLLIANKQGVRKVRCIRAVWGWVSIYQRTRVVTELDTGV